MSGKTPSLHIENQQNTIRAIFLRRKADFPALEKIQSGAERRAPVRTTERRTALRVPYFSARPEPVNKSYRQHLLPSPASPTDEARLPRPGGTPHKRRQPPRRKGDSLRPAGKRKQHPTEKAQSENAPEREAQPQLFFRCATHAPRRNSLPLYARRQEASP